MQVLDNTPSTGEIEWKSVHISYMGNVYTIPDGYTNAIYTYWLYASPNQFQFSNTFPTIGDNDVVVFLNKNGIHATVPNTTIVDGSLIVPESIMTNALAANSVTATQLAAGSVTANAVAANAIGANAIASNAITTDKIAIGAITTDSIDSSSYAQMNNANVQVGGRNLVSDSNFSRNWNIDDANYQNAGLFNCSDGSISANDSNGFIGSGTPTNSGENAFARIYHEANAADFLHAGYYIWKSYGATFTNCIATLDIDRWGENWSGLPGSGNNQQNTPFYLDDESAAEIARVVIKVTAIDQTKDFSFSIPKIKLELGNVATDWSPAPEDQTAYADSVAAPGQTAYEQVNVQTVSAATDLNTMTTTGKFLITGTLTNSPLAAWIYLIVNNANPMRIVQTVYKDNDSSQQWQRVYNGSWTTWTRIATSTDVNTAQTNAQNYADSQYSSTKSTVSTNQAIWNLASNINSNGTFNTNKLNGTLADSQIASSGTWNSATNLLNSWKSGTTLINGGMIATNSIFANAIAIGDFTNLAPDPSFEQGANSWNGNGYDVNSSQYHTGSHSMHVQGSSQVKDFNTMYPIPCQGGDQFYGEVWIKAANNSGAGTGNVGLETTYNGPGMPTTWGQFVDVRASSVSSGWTKISGTITIPSGYTQLYIRLSIRDNVTAGDYYFDDVVVRHMLTGNLIVDGAITANELNIQSLDAIAANMGKLTINELLTLPYIQSNGSSGVSETQGLQGSYDITETNNAYARRRMQGNMFLGGSSVYYVSKDTILENSDVYYSTNYYGANGIKLRGYTTSSDNSYDGQFSNLNNRIDIFPNGIYMGTTASTTSPDWGDNIIIDSSGWIKSGSMELNGNASLQVIGGTDVFFTNGSGTPITADASAIHQVNYVGINGRSSWSSAVNMTYGCYSGGGHYFQNTGGVYEPIYYSSAHAESLWSEKTNFEPVDQVSALNNVINTDVVKYSYKDHTDEKNVGLIIDDRPDGERTYYTSPDFLTPDKKFKMDGNIVGELMLSVKELKEEIDTLNSNDDIREIRIEQLEQDKNDLLLKIANLEERLISLES